MSDKRKRSADKKGDKNNRKKSRLADEKGINKTTKEISSKTNSKAIKKNSQSDIQTVTKQSILSQGSANAENSQSSAVVKTNVDKELTNGSQQTPQTDANGSDPPKTNKKKKNRCTKCKINVGVIGFPCRCGGTFCSTHRYANEHNCTFDYREHGAEEIRKNNPQVIGEKVTKI
ncbi:AN1-type zinc finger protein 6-like isoform X2 [Oppia nitens]|uniref:AN1-type zinc finger protein 6-like isoform X2 n=1 Tax=Oppia nitens TaxID=1686743 RepID=UPI0023DC7766|nr:AN1-type zinc finger protein 6-like isoform X2 [Oppia nitens]